MSDDISPKVVMNSPRLRIVLEFATREVNEYGTAQLWKRECDGKLHSQWRIDLGDMEELPRLVNLIKFMLEHVHV